MKQNKIALTFLLISFINGFAFSQLPVSKQATLVESVSSSEVMIEATGIYKGKGKKDRHKKKDVVKNGGNISAFVPSVVNEALLSKYSS